MLSSAQEAIRRADALKELHDRSWRERSELPEWNEELDSALRDHADRLATQTSCLEQPESEHSALQPMADELESDSKSTKEQHVRVQVMALSKFV